VDSGRNRKRGAILILTLWVVALLSLMAQGVILRARLSLREAEWADVEAQAGRLMQAVTALAVDRLAEDENLAVDSYKEAWARPYTAESSDLMAQYPSMPAKGEGFSLEIRAVDELGKVNINLAPLNMLVAVLREYGAGSRATDIAKAVVDWRDTDDIGPAERDLYQNFDPPYAPSDQDFKSIDELLFVQGVDANLFFGEDANRNGVLDPNEDDGDAFWPPDNMDGQLQAGLVDAFTVYGDGTININTAPAPVIYAVLRLSMLNDPSADSLAEEILAKRQGRDKTDATDDDSPFESDEEIAAFLSVLMGEQEPVNALRAASPFGVTTEAFRFHARVRFPERHYELASEIVVKREDGQLTMLEFHDGE